MEDDPKQVDLFGDFRKQAEVMKSIGGYFVGRFTGDPDEPVVRESQYYRTENEAEKALQTNTWKPPLP